MPSTSVDAFNCVVLSLVPYVMTSGAGQLISGVACSTAIATFAVAVV